MMYQVGKVGIFEFMYHSKKIAGYKRYWKLFAEITGVNGKNLQLKDNDGWILEINFNDIISFEERPKIKR